MQERTLFQGDVTFSVRGKGKTQYLKSIESAHPEFFFHSDYNGRTGGLDVLTLIIPDETMDDPIENVKKIVEDASKNGISVNGQISDVEQEGVDADKDNPNAFCISTNGRYVITNGKIRDFTDEDGSFECNDGLDDTSPMPVTRRTRNGERGRLVTEAGDAIFERLSEYNHGTEPMNPVGLHNGLEDLVDDTIGEYCQSDDEDEIRLNMSTIDGLVIPDILDGINSIGKSHFKSYVPLSGRAFYFLGDELSSVFRKHRA